MSVRKSISSSYFSMTAVVLVTSILAMGFLQMYLSMEYFKADKEQTLDSIVSIAAQRTTGMIEDDWNNAEALRQMQSSMDLIGQTSSVLVFATDTQGRVVVCSEGAFCTQSALVPEKVLNQLKTEEKYFEVGTLGGAQNKRSYTCGRPIYTADGSLLGFAFASADANGLGVFISDMFSSFILSAGLMLLVASVLSIFLTSRLTTPLRRISAAARKFGGGDFSARVPVEGDDEVAQLAQTFNNMAQSLETIDSSRSSFMGNIAHELRTPMTTIKGFIDGMLDGTIPPAMQQHYLSLVSQEVGRLARLTQNMLDITKLEAGEYKVNAQSYDIWETVTTVVLSAEQRLEERRIQIEGLPPAGKAVVYADADLVYQVLYNIFDNAVKFTPEGGTIRLSVARAGGVVTVGVRNTGEGISADALPFVFERFYKEDKSRGLNARGSGLGLHICKVLVTLSGGKIWAESEQGQWCQFNFTLPCEPGHEPGRGRPGRQGRAI